MIDACKIKTTSQIYKLFPSHTTGVEASISVWKPLHWRTKWFDATRMKPILQQVCGPDRYQETRTPPVLLRPKEKNNLPWKNCQFLKLAITRSLKNFLAASLNGSTRSGLFSFRFFSILYQSELLPCEQTTNSTHFWSTHSLIKAQGQIHSSSLRSVTHDILLTPSCSPSCRLGIPSCQIRFW